MTAVLRFAEMSDLPAVREFGRRVVVSFYESIGLPDYGEAMVRQYWESEAQSEAISHRQVILTSWGDRVDGVAEFGRYENEPIMWKLYVESGARRNGIGSALVDAVVKAALTAEDSTLLVEHPAENETAGRFYEQMGSEPAWVDEGDGPGSTTVWRRKTIRQTAIHIGAKACAPGNRHATACPSPRV